METALLPELNIADYLENPHSSAGDNFVQQLRETCHSTGFFYLTGHGIKSENNDQVLDVANRFFALPLPEREKLAIVNSPHFRGYTLLEQEMTNGVRDWRDQIDFGPDEPALPLKPDDPPWLRLRGPNQWPDSLPQMRTTLNDWMTQMQFVGVTLVGALARGLGLGADHFIERIIPDPYTRVKVIRYPAQPASGGTGQGLGLHHDSGILTMILQDEVNGLQVLCDDKLIDVEPRAGAFVVNLGEMMQSATGGYLRATKHQVVSPPPGKQRISVAYFFNPRLESKFEPVTLPPDLDRHAIGGQNLDPTDPVFTTFGANTLKIRMRAHPDVTSAHYADVEFSSLTDNIGTDAV